MVGTFEIPPDDSDEMTSFETQVDETAAAATDEAARPTRPRARRAR